MVRRKFSIVAVMLIFSFLFITNVVSRPTPAEQTKLRAGLVKQPELSLTEMELLKLKNITYRLTTINEEYQKNLLIIRHTAELKRLPVYAERTKLRNEIGDRLDIDVSKYDVSSEGILTLKEKPKEVEEKETAPEPENEK